MIMKKQKKNNDIISTLTPETVSELNIDELRNEAVRKAKTVRHQWKQKGAWLVCSSCEYTHAVWIGTNRLMTGVDKEGNPILKDRHQVFKKKI